MANNPWAQAYAAGGLWMVTAFALGYSMALGTLTVLFRKTEGAMKAGVAVIGVWVGFYFHRNDLYIEIGYLKHVVYIFALAVLVALALNQFSVSRPKRQLYNLWRRGLSLPDARKDKHENSANPPLR